jgi:uncharacterized DUF497 family protein
MNFDWDEHNLFHISMHGVTRQEAEEALTISPLSVERMIRGGETRTLNAGITETGRILAVVTTPRGDRIRVVTAFTAGRRVRIEYLAKKGAA